MLGRPRENTVLVHFRSLEQERTDHGTAYFSTWRPKVTIDGERKTVAFYRHAAERICERSVGAWKTYGGLGDAFAFLNDCVYFEPWRCSDGRPGFTLYNSCAKGFLTELFAARILGQSLSEKPWYYRVGYCPAVECGDLLIARTLLLPGMRQTPERMWAVKNMSSDEVRELDSRTPQLSLDELAKTDDFRLLKRFHDAGIVQVIAFDHEVFRYAR